VKKQIIVLAVAGAVIMPAIAQNKITPYGIVDMAVTHVSNKSGAASTEVNSGNLNTSRFGFRGNEDMGGGLSAVFQLESSITVDTGAAGSSTAFWNRQAWVGLASTTLGQLKLGYQRPVMYDLLGPLSHTPPFGAPAARIDGAAVAGTALARFDNTIGTTRFANSIKYSTADMAGFKLHGFLALGEVAGSESAGRTANVGVGYKRGPLQAGLSYLVTNCKEAAGCPANRDDDSVLGAGAGYDFGPATFNALFTRQKNARNIVGNDADTMSLALIVPVNAWQLAAGYQTLNDKSNLDQNVKEVNLSATYSLSKRTALYAIYCNQRVDNGGKAGISFLSGNDKQNQLSLGLRHYF
jgi:GBP family porin